jgi:hypothetical protein
LDTFIPSSDKGRKSVSTFTYLPSFDVKGMESRKGGTGRNDPIIAR